jgi:hypothetical protein
MYWGSTDDGWDPEGYLSSRYPSIEIRDYDLPGRLQGFYERKRGIIWLSTNLSLVERRSTLAYQAGKLEQGPTPEDPCLAAMHERAAMDWAARMLIPSHAFAAAWARCLDLAQMAAYCDVDLPMFRARIRAASDADQDAAIAAIIDTRLSA